MYIFAIYMCVRVLLVFTITVIKYFMLLYFYGCDLLFMLIMPLLVNFSSMPGQRSNSDNKSNCCVSIVLLLYRLEKTCFLYKKSLLFDNCIQKSTAFGTELMLVFHAHLVDSQFIIPWLY